MMEQKRHMRYYRKGAEGVNPLRKSLKIIKSPADKKAEYCVLKPLLREKININTVLKNIYKRFSNIALMRGLEFRYDTTLDGFEAEILTDGKLLDLIISSLIRNAIAVTDNGYISFGYMKKNEYIEFYVADTGKGFLYIDTDDISEDKRPRTIPTLQGVNVNAGINDCNVLVKAMGGRMWIKSDPWDGSLCQFTIPYIKDL